MKTYGKTSLKASITGLRRCSLRHTIQRSRDSEASFENAVSLLREPWESLPREDYMHFSARRHSQNGTLSTYNNRHSTPDPSNSGYKGRRKCSLRKDNLAEKNNLAEILNLREMHNLEEAHNPSRQYKETAFKRPLNDNGELQVKYHCDGP